MPWEKVSRLFLNRTFLVFVLVGLFLVTRLPYLGPDAINPDAVNWHYRSEQFIVGLKNGIWEKTYQHYHPGVTLMWIMGPTIEIARQLSPELRVYDHTNFLYLHALAKHSVVFVQLFLTLGFLYVWSRFLDFHKAFLIVLLFSLEPFFIGNSRMLHMDVLLTLFLGIGLGLAYLALTSDTKRVLRISLSGVFLGLSFLTKSIAIGGILFVLGMWFLVNFKKLRTNWWQGLLLLGAFVFTVFVFFPAMWTSPWETFYRIFDEAERVGIRKGHSQIFFGQDTRDPGIFFYPVVAFLKTSPLLLIGVLAFLVSLFKNRLRLKNLTFFGFLTVFFSGYMLVMTISGKKIDRYLIPVFPYLAYMAILGFERVLKIHRKFFAAFGGTVFLVGLNFLYHPYQFTYFTPLVGSAGTAHYMVAQKPFGIGIPYLKELILDSYGRNYPPLGFYDTKPMKTIYRASRVADVAVNGVSDYFFLVLGPNEEMPQEVLDSGYTFMLDKTIKINGLDYWRIYARQGTKEE